MHILRLHLFMLLDEHLRLALLFLYRVLSVRNWRRLAIVAVEFWTILRLNIGACRKDNFLGWVILIYIDMRSLSTTATNLPNFLYKLVKKWIARCLWQACWLLLLLLRENEVALLSIVSRLQCCDILINFCLISNNSVRFWLVWGASKFLNFGHSLLLFLKNIGCVSSHTVGDWRVSDTPLNPSFLPATCR